MAADPGADLVDTILLEMAHDASRATVSRPLQVRCVDCGGLRDRRRGRGWWPTCRSCHAAMMRRWRRARR